MKRVFVTIFALLAVVWAGAQTREAAAEAADTAKHWTYSVLSNLNIGQSKLSQWAAGGYDNMSLSGQIDASANYEKGKVMGLNRMQVEYGFIWSADRPVVQKNRDRFYLEFKWGYESSIRHLSYSASYDFKTQINNNYNYQPPSDALMEKYKDHPARAWREAARENLKSGLLSPAYANLGLGVLWTPAPNFTLNFAPLTASAVFVTDEQLRKMYGMELQAPKLGHSDNSEYMSVSMGFGTQVKADAQWVIHDELTYTTQFTLFYNYLRPRDVPRITWDNKVYWKLRKYFAITLTTNLIYDPRVLVRDSTGDGTADTSGVQFKEFLDFGFVYSFVHKR